MVFWVRRLHFCDIYDMSFDFASPSNDAPPIAVASAIDNPG